jgi:hypothetical protein
VICARGVLKAVAVNLCTVMLYLTGNALLAGAGQDIESFYEICFPYSEFPGVRYIYSDITVQRYSVNDKLI